MNSYNDAINHTSPDVIEKLCRLAKEAGSVIMSIYESNFEVQYKADRSPLTAADKASHKVIVEGLKIAFPAIPILSEEGADIDYAKRKKWERFWLVDPLDGTKEFIKHNGEFTVNIALIEGQAPILGLIYVPAQDKLYWGLAGNGAWKRQGNNKPEVIKVRKPNREKGLTIVMSRSHPSPELENYLKKMKIAEALPMGSSLKFCAVAEGKADLYPRFGPTMEWDTAAGNAIVLAAGGQVATLEGGTLKYNKAIWLNPFFIVSAQTLQS